MTLVILVVKFSPVASVVVFLLTGFVLLIPIRIPQRDVSAFLRIRVTKMYPVPDKLTIANGSDL